MKNILKNLLDVKTDLSLGTISMISENEVIFDLNGSVVRAKNIKENKTHWEDEDKSLEPIESILLECTLGLYIDRILNMYKKYANSILNQKYNLKEINYINLSIN